MWDLIIIATSDSRWKTFFEKECQQLSKELFPPHHELLVIRDPYINDTQCAGDGYTNPVGSGGTIINAILVAAETFSAKAGRSMINSDDMKQCRILIVPVGRPNARQWMINPDHELHFMRSKNSLPNSLSKSIPMDVAKKLLFGSTQLLDALWNSTKLSANYSKGVWIASYDCGLMQDSDCFPPPHPTLSTDDTLVNLFTLKMRREEAKDHGIVLFDDNNLIRNVIYKPTEEQMDSLGIGSECDVISGQLYLSPLVAEKLLNLHLFSPFTHCTHHACDMGLKPFTVSLYFDLLGALFTDVNKTDFTSNNKCNGNSLLYLARKLAYEKLSGIPLFKTALQSFKFCYLTADVPRSVAPEQLDYRIELVNCSVKGEIVQKVPCDRKLNCSLTNCYIGLNWSVSVGPGTTVYDLHLEDRDTKKQLDLGSGYIWQQCYLSQFNSSTSSSPLIVCLGSADDRMSEYPESNVLKTRLNSSFSWDKLFVQTNSCVEEMWPLKSMKNIFNARMFTDSIPIHEQIERFTFKASRSSSSKNMKLYSMSDILMQADLVAFGKQKELLLESLLLERIEEKTANARDIDAQKCLHMCRILNPGLLKSLFFRVRDLALNAAYKDPIALTRLVAFVSDILSSQAGWKGNIRTGPVSNSMFTEGYNKIEKGQLTAGISSLFSAFKSIYPAYDCQETHDCALLSRGARHFQKAISVLISHQILDSVKLHTRFYRSDGNVQCPPPGVWVEAVCPARIDLSGGWSDTPPICYELGGAVVNAAIKLNGLKPIRIRARFTDDPKKGGVVCVLKNGGSFEEPYKGALVGSIGQGLIGKGREYSEHTLHWTDISDFRDYDNPLVPGALIKSALFYCHFINVHGVDLKSQLKRYNCIGLELEIHSLLPKGSGLGGSSLIGGALLGVLAVITGHSPVTPDVLMHGTLALEQLMSTGGGWQDQVGGLYGGIKCGVSPQGIHTKVLTYGVPINEAFTNYLERKLFLCYTGQVRLAKNLLQTVIRSWYTGNKDVYNTFSSLSSLAYSTSDIMMTADTAGFEKNLYTYSTYKNTLVPESLTGTFLEIIKALTPYIAACSPAGAGGGGYMCCLLNEKGEAKMKNSTVLLEQIREIECEASFDMVEIDPTGLVIWVGEEKVLEFGSPEESIEEYLKIKK